MIRRRTGRLTRRDESSRKRSGSSPGWKRHARLRARHAALGLLGLLPLIASAHHAFEALFDAARIVELDGEITSVFWANPHVRYELRAEDGRTWEIETNGISILRRMEIPRDVIGVGDRVQLAGHPARRGREELFVVHALLDDGREVVFRPDTAPRWSERVVGTDETWTPRRARAAQAPAGIFRVWSTDLSDPESWPLLPPDRLETYPLTDAARRAVERFDARTDGPAQRCAPQGMPLVMAHPDPIELVDAGETIELHLEYYDTVRTIHMQPASPPSDTPRSRLGYSAGRWEDETLVVTTTRLDWPHFDNAGIPFSPAAEIVERFTPSDDGTRLEYWMRVTDPRTFAEPVVLDKHWAWVPENRLERYECTPEGVASLLRRQTQRENVLRVRPIDDSEDSR